ncbi:hypothetical protein Fuma_02914 [Fuerstiella marisgermanici]|uniref:Uncharacterized protein n=1 Tax=Fuerstiella marisgermanici TaxID=1891926 RepID=A0A1P8WGZ9_9PLAN|nr:hypothetical protein Fuma_02914 [Fuerstiella marisgermanici]
MNSQRLNGVFSRIKSFFCRSDKPSQEDAEQAVSQLIQLGFLKYLPETAHDVVRAQLIESVRNNYLDSEWDDECVSADKRSYPADAENLAEGDVGKCLRGMRAILSTEGVSLNAVEDRFTDSHKRYEVWINGTPHLIYDLNEISMEEIWGEAFRRLIQIVNLFLEEAGSNERLFGIAGGNDGRVIFLTPTMHELLVEKGDIFDERWTPVTGDDLR